MFLKMKEVLNLEIWDEQNFYRVMIFYLYMVIMVVCICVLFGIFLLK